MDCKHSTYEINVKMHFIGQNMVVNIPYLILQPSGSKLGLPHLPLLESFGGEESEPNFPTGSKIRNEQNAIHRSISQIVRKKKGDNETWLKNGWETGSFPLSSSTPQWPQIEAELTEDASEGN